VLSILEARNLDKETVKSNEKMYKEALSTLINYAAASHCHCDCGHLLSFSRLSRYSSMGWAE
jgi:hypothetical protein